MKVISLWQPYATLLICGFKQYETRPFPPPRTLEYGERIAIAATKQIKPEQVLAAEHPRLLRHYHRLQLPYWKELPRGCILGTMILSANHEIGNDTIEDLDEMEYVFGDWREGRWAWMLRRPIALKNPIPVRGQQGIWNYNDKRLEDQS